MMSVAKYWSETIDEPTYRAVLTAIAENQGLPLDEVLAAYPLSDYADGRSLAAQKMSSGEEEDSVAGGDDE